MGQNTPDARRRRRHMLRNLRLMRSLLLPLIAFITFAASAPVMAGDLNFYEAAHQCAALTDAHPFRVRVLVGKRSTYSFEEDTPFSRCLAREAEAKDENGNERRRSLGAQLERMVELCGTKLGRTGSFYFDFTPRPDGYFSAESGPEPSKTRSCIALFAMVSKPMGFGAKQ